MNEAPLSVSLVIPVFNESETIEELLLSLSNQQYLPDEVVIVDGGSTDTTVQQIKNFATDGLTIRLIEVERAMPGQGRNIGTKAARNEWIAYTDAGIQLDSDWLLQLVNAAKQHSEAVIIYGNYHPQVNSFFDQCSAIAYVPAVKPGTIRGKSIVSYLFKKRIWEQVGGFPDWRAAEDLVFMEHAEKGNVFSEAPLANARWQLRPNFSAMFKKFDLYSMYNVWAGKQKDWHYGIAKHYLLVAFSIIAGVFFHKAFLLFIPAWLLARALKRIYAHRYEFGNFVLINPFIYLEVMLILLVIDMATFSGWIKAYRKKNRMFSATPS